MAEQLGHPFVEFGFLQLEFDWSLGFAIWDLFILLFASFS